MWLSIANYIRHFLAKHPQGWHPMLAVYYLNYDCDFRCPFCSDGAKRPYHTLKSPLLDGPQVIDLLKTIRRYSDYLVITGGEPTKHPQLPYVLDKLSSCNFDGVVFTTNGYDLELHLDKVAKSIDYLVFSLETLDEEKADQYWGVPGAQKKILEVIEKAKNHPQRKYEIIISSLALPDNLKDLYAVYDYCLQEDFRLALCPQLVGVKAHEDLHDNEDYVAIWNHLLAGKKEGKAVNGTTLYLEHMRDLRKFTCHPSTVLAVSPMGDVFYPCLERGHIAGNLCENPDLHEIRKLGQKLHGPEPDCDNRCHSACALGLSLILEYPSSLLSESYYELKGLLR